MLGTIINVIAVTIGSTIGILVGRKYSEEMRTITMHSLGLITLILGMAMALQSIEGGLGATDFLVLIFSLVLGSITGVILQIESRMERFGGFLKEKTKSGETRFIEGFVVASIVFETGPLSILGAIQDGFGQIDLLVTKSALDGFASIAFAASMGIGVFFAIIPVFVYQGTITAFSLIISPSIPIYVEQMMNVVGGAMILAIGLKLLDIKDVKVGNMIPAIFWVIPLGILIPALGLPI